MKLILVTLVTLLVGFMLPSTLNAADQNLQLSQSKTIYVKATAVGLDNGSSWENAYTSLQSALASANRGDEIWVAAGTYKPTINTDRTVTFQLKNGIAVYGGFVGAEASRAQRNWRTNTTILSGDIGVEGESNDNSYHVIYTTGLTSETTVLDGFVITRGNANGISPNNDGGGVYNTGSDEDNPIMVNLKIVDNQASHDGGGMFNFLAAPHLVNVYFSDNVAENLGGGMFVYGVMNMRISNASFTGNYARQGAAINADSVTLTINNCTMVANFANNAGSAIAIVHYRASLTASNCIFWNNMAVDGANFAALGRDGDTRFPPMPSVSYSLVQGGYTGTGNIDADPKFMNLANSDLHLRSDSPAVNAGDNSGLSQDLSDLDSDSDKNEAIPHDLDGNHRLVGSSVDMGAYERGIDPEFPPTICGQVKWVAYAECGKSGQPLTVPANPIFFSQTPKMTYLLDLSRKFPSLTEGAFYRIYDPITNPISTLCGTTTENVNEQIVDWSKMELVPSCTEGEVAPIPQPVSSCTESSESACTPRAVLFARYSHYNKTNYLLGCIAYIDIEEEVLSGGVQAVSFLQPLREIPGVGETVDAIPATEALILGEKWAVEVVKALDSKQTFLDAAWVVFVDLAVKAGEKFVNGILSFNGLKLSKSEAIQDATVGPILNQIAETLNRQKDDWVRLSKAPTWKYANLYHYADYGTLVRYPNYKAFSQEYPNAFKYLTNAKVLFCPETNVGSGNKSSDAKPAATAFTDLSANMPIDGPARFNFRYSGTTSTFRVDVSTLSDMSWEVYLNFATGSKSPLVESQPTKWDKYSCGRTLYWRVISDTGAQSSIQSTKVICTAAQATAEQANLNAPFSNLSAILPINGPAQFNFTFAGRSSDFRIDVSTVADMHIDVYLGFAVGTVSPLIETNPTKWDKVSCGRTLYWRVVSNRGAQSSIQSTEVVCTEGQATVEQANLDSPNAIAFTSFGADSGGIYLMNPDGGNQRKLSMVNAVEPFFGLQCPTWSPDGKEIGFYWITRSSEIGDIYIVHNDGTNLRNSTNSLGWYGNPAWSPKGNLFAYSIAMFPLRLIQVDSPNSWQIRDSGDDHNLAWSPDGQRLVMNSYTFLDADAVSNIFMINSDGTGLTQLTNGSWIDIDPAWSPDDSKIAFASNRDGDAEIFVMNTNGSNVQQLTNNGAYDSAPTWSPDSSQTAFVTNRDGNNEIYVMNADGTNQHNITNSSNQDLCPAWHHTPS